MLITYLKIVTPCVHFVSVCLKIKSGHRLTLKKLFTQSLPTNHHPSPATRKLFLVSNERYGQINTLLLCWYGIDFASIKIYINNFIFWLYIRRQRFSFYDLSLSLFCSVWSLHLLSVWSLPLLSVCLISISFVCLSDISHLSVCFLH